MKIWRTHFSHRSHYENEKPENQEGVVSATQDENMKCAINPKPPHILKFSYSTNTQCAKRYFTH